MTLAGMMVRDGGITNDKEINRRMGEEGETEARAKDEGKGFNARPRLARVGKRYGNTNRGSSFEPKDLPSLPPLADHRMNQTPLLQLRSGSVTNDPLPLRLCSCQKSQLAILHVWRQCRQRSALETINSLFAPVKDGKEGATPCATPAPG
jgi:hypothetical protein